MSRPRVVTFGETMALLAAREVGPLRTAATLDLSLGGSESNCAVGLQRLGVQTAWCGHVGDDEFGVMIRDRLRAEGVDTSEVRLRDDAPTGLMFKERRTASVSRVTYYRRDSAGSRIGPEDLDAELIGSAEILHVTGITPALSQRAAAAVEAALDIAVRAGTRVSVDVNYRSQLWPAERAAEALRALAARADVVFVNVAEGGMLLGLSEPQAIARELTEQGCADAVVKLAAEGALAVVGDELHRQDARRVQVADPVGAGDAFAAGYLAGLLDGDSPQQRLRLACDLGAFAVTTRGDFEGLPTRAELAALLDETGQVQR